MKRLLLFLISLSLSNFGISQSSGNFTANDLCYNTSTSCFNTENSYQIVMPYDGKIVFTGTVNGTTSSPNPVTFSIYTYIDYMTFEGNNAGQTVGVVQNETGPLIEMETSGLLAGTVVDVYIGASFSSTYASSGGYNIDYYVIPPTYNNDPEPNDNYTQAINTTENTFYEGHGSFIPDAVNNINESEDWYKLTVPVNGTLNVTINHDTVIDGYFSTSLQMLRQNNDGTVTGIGYESNDTNGLLLASVYCLKQGDVIFLKIAGNDNSYQMYWNMQEPLGYIDNEPNDLDSQALTINLNETKYGNIGYGITPDSNGYALDDDSDWYKFDVVESGDATITLNASQNFVYITEAFYEEENGTLTPIYFENSGPDDPIYNFNCIVEGTYYVMVKDYTSSPLGIPGYGSCQDCCSTYSISYTFSNPTNYSSDETEPNNDFSTAEYLPFNTNFNGQIGYRISDVVDYDDNYLIQPIYNGALEISFSEPFIGTVFFYYYEGIPFSVGNINTNTNGEVTSVSIPCAAEGETYYLALYSASCTSYQLYATNSYSGENGELEPNNTTNDSQTLGEYDNVFGQVGYGNISNLDNYDYYDIPISNSAPIEFYFDLYGDSTVELRNDFSMLTSITQDQNSGSITSLTYNNIESSSNYFLRITGNSCTDYDLYGWNQNFTAENDTEPNNSQFETTAINFNQDYEGRLSYYSSGSDTEDYYSFSLSQNDDVEFQLNAFEGLNNNASLTVYDAVNSNQVFQLNHDGTNSSRTTNTINLNAGNYYFIITGTDQTGSYDFRVTPQNTLSLNNFIDITASIFPNPAKDEIKISLNNHHEDISASIVDITGKSVNTFVINSSETQLNITSLERGLYFIVFKTDTSTITKRFIKH
ncbi:T9SS type A sorting domain-containing protein [Winogradskyella poriferorum]|uniref:T9SS type A sorting domain-containing protein n=1 Tax=Winogradskyella poriferorum TaxID=307627 RepID=A0ABU7WAL6_9FLAO